MSPATTQNHHQSSTIPPTDTTPPRSKSQRVFTDGDEIRILKSFLTAAAAKSSKKSNRNPNQTTTTAINSPVLDHIKTSLNDEFTYNQLSDKLRRLRIKYRKQARSRSLIKTPHDRRVFEISQKIWGKRKPNPQSNSPPQQQQENSVEGEELFDDVVMMAREEEIAEAEEGDRQVHLAELPALVAEMSRALPGKELWKEGLKVLDEGTLRGMNEEWRELHIEEAKVVARRARLVQEHVVMILQAIEPASFS